MLDLDMYFPEIFGLVTFAWSLFYFGVKHVDVKMYFASTLALSLGQQSW
uniref:Uncharacterized protein n=1 Tax=Rhizophora mucronata TaxID=61149 RepID=A0A2P2N7L4_RHIMU